MWHEVATPKLSSLSALKAKKAAHVIDLHEELDQMSGGK